VAPHLGQSIGSDMAGFFVLANELRSIWLHGCRLIDRALSFAASWTRLTWESCEFNDVLIATRGPVYRWVLALSTKIARRLSVRLERV
jgi:hypothetical protein